MKLRNATRSSSMLWSMSTKGRENGNCGSPYSAERSPSSLQKGTGKSTVRVSAVNASDEERLQLPKSDGNPKRTQRYR